MQRNGKRITFVFAVNVTIKILTAWKLFITRFAFMQLVACNSDRKTNN